MAEVKIDRHLCVACGACVADCLWRVLELKGQRAYPEHPKRCSGCGHCVAICPTGAVSFADYADGSPEEQEKLLGDSVAADDLLALLRMRRSVRSYRPQLVEKEKVQMLLEAGRTSPTAKNKEALRFILLEKEGLTKATVLALKALVDGSKHLGLRREHLHFSTMLRAFEKGVDRLFFHAPHVIVIVQKEGYSNLDAGIAVGKMETLANALGLGALINGYFTYANDDQRLRDFLGLAEEERLAITMAFGYGKTRYLRPAPRKPLQMTIIDT